MTEENKDSAPKKLRLSSKPKDMPEAGSKTKAENGDSSEGKPDLKLNRPPSAPEPAKASEPKKDEPDAPKPQIKDPAQSGAEPPSATAAGERPFDPENPFASTDVKKPKTGGQPPELPSKPAPQENDGSGRKVEEAIDRIGEDKKKGPAILTSIIVIIILLGILGGSGYGLYYILRSPADSTNASAATEEKSQPKDSDDKPGGLLSGPIAKAKAAIEKMPDPEGSLTEEEAPVTPEPETEKVNEVDTTEGTETAEAPAVPESETESPSIDSSQTDSVSAFLQNAHIGGVRTGDRPKLILNGQSYNKGDLVDPDTGLRFSGIRDGKLAFRDTQDIVYLKSF